MRTYIGSVLRQPENVIVIRNVFFEGLVSGHTGKVSARTPKAQNEKVDEPNVNDFDLVKVRVPATYLAKHKTCINWADWAEGGTQKENDTREDLVAIGILEEKGGKYTVAKHGPNGGPGFPSRVYRGTTYDKGTETVKQRNTGHMGNLDHCRSVPRLYGAGSFVYDSNPDPRNTRA